MKKPLLIIATIALLGTLAAVVNPLGTKENAASTSKVTTSASSSAVASTAAAGSSAATQYKDGTYQGSDVSNRYEDIQVSVTISGGKITAVHASLNAQDDTSQSIAGDAIASLKQATLTAQSASLDGVSGATEASASYIQSLQSAIDKAKA